MQKVANYCVCDALNRQKVKLFLCLIEHHAKMKYGIIVVQLYSFVTQSLNWGERSTLNRY